nr:hypothetical protein - wheat dwarf virus [Wheat dwarf virus]
TPARLNGDQQGTESHLPCLHRNPGPFVPGTG